MPPRRASRSLSHTTVSPEQGLVFLPKLYPPSSLKKRFACRGRAIFGQKRSNPAIDILRCKAM
eukprot:3486661-Amphidinium_carterae.1